MLQTYKSQRPYVFLLRNAYVRRNELFFLYEQPVTIPISQPLAAARIPIAR